MSNNINDFFYKVNDALLNLDKPSDFFIENLDNEVFDIYPFSVIKELDKVEQSPIHHKEGNVFKHTMLTIDMGAKVRDKSLDKQAFMWGLFLHDIGKISTTKIRKGKITSYKHDIVGEKMVREFLETFGFLDEDFILRVSKIVRWHMQVMFVSNGRKDLYNLNQMVEEVNINEIALVCYCDRMGRVDVDENSIKKKIDFFIEKASKI
ncbi:MAG: HDIG domain-containing metalloprotein [Lachnospirales bacterium]